MLSSRVGSCSSLAAAGSRMTRLYAPTMTSSTSSRWGTGAALRALAAASQGIALRRAITGLTHCAPMLLRWLADTFGYIPRQGWQIDTFGHSGVNAALYALSGMDSMFFSRLDTEVRAATLRRTTS